MTTKRFELDLPEDVLARFGWQDTEVPKRVREALVMELVRKHAISQGKAAELLGITRSELFPLMAQYEVPAIDLPVDELERELSQDHGQDNGR